jgi:SAM-dependent methyltransferase
MLNSVNMCTSKPLHPQCPLCSGTFTKFRHGWLFVCSNCGLLASNIEPKIPAHSEPTFIDENRRARGLAHIRTRNNNIVLDCIQKILNGRSKRLLDVGSGLGFFLKDAAARGFDVTGIEPDANVIDELRKTGFCVRHGYFPHQLQPDEEFDVIVFNDVLEHIPDLMGTLEACATHLRPAGLLVLNCPNRHGVFYRIADLLDRVGLHGPFDRMWQRDVQSPHVWYFKPNDLRHLGEQLGLVWAQTLDLLPITLQGISYRIFYVRNQSVFMGAIALLGTLLLMPLLTILPRDISVVILRKKAE